MKKVIAFVIAAGLALGLGFGFGSHGASKVADQPAVEKPMADPPSGG